MKPILKSAKPSSNGQPSAKSRKYFRSELFFEVKPYTQTVIFTDKNTAQDQQTPPRVNSFTNKKDEMESLDRNEVHNLEKWIDYNKHKQSKFYRFFLFD